jgi:hypothetical protein
MTANTRISFSEFLKQQGALKELEQQKGGLEIPESLGSSILDSSVPAPDDPNDIFWAIDRAGKRQPLDQYQRDAVNAVLSGQDCCIIGAAGSGKSTIMQVVIRELGKREHRTISYKLVGKAGAREDAPDFAIVAFTNTAVNGIRDKLHQAKETRDFAGSNILTMHGLVEMKPVDEYSSKKEKMVRIFRPSRTKENPVEVKFLAIEEASMAGVGPGQIANLVYDALGYGVQIVLIGDINQLTPVGGKSILCYGLLQLPTYELKHIHRQALENPIIFEAHQVLKGHAPKQHLKDGKGVARLPLTKLTQTLSAEAHLKAWNRILPKLLDEGKYEPSIDMVICPYTKAEGTALTNNNINAGIAGILAKRESRIVHEILTGFGTAIYLAVGDRILSNKQLGTVLAIDRNKNYYGKQPKESGLDLNYFGLRHGSIEHEHEEDIGMDMESSEFDYSMLDILDLEKLANGNGNDKEEEQGTRQASHSVLIALDGQDEPVLLATAGELSPVSFSLGYSMTDYKAQGNEWRNVYIHLHLSHRNALNRECVYTSMTRAKELVILCGQEFAYARAAKNAKLRGNTLEEKIEYFKGGYLDQDFTVSRRALAKSLGLARQNIGGNV